MIAPRLLTVAQVARRLAVKRSYVLRLIRRRDLARVRVGRYWRVEPEAVERYISTHRDGAREDDPPVVDDRQRSLFEEEPDRLALAEEPAPVEPEPERVGLSSSLDPEDVPF